MQVKFCLIFMQLLLIHFVVFFISIFIWQFCPILRFAKQYIIYMVVVNPLARYCVVPPFITNFYISIFFHYCVIIGNSYLLQRKEKEKRTKKKKKRKTPPIKKKPICYNNSSYLFQQVNT